jgi:multidrug transporter EmrE-like cation transporter
VACTVAGMLAVALAALFNVGLNVAFKLAAEHEALTKYLFLGGGLALGGGYAFFFSRALEKLDLGVAYPIFAGASVVLTLVVGLALFGESFAWTKAIGGAMVVAGIAIAFR